MLSRPQPIESTIEAPHLPRCVTFATGTKAMKNTTLALFIGLAVCGVASPQDTSSGTGRIIVEIVGLENDRGSVMVSLCADAAGFPPSDIADTVDRAFVSIHEGRAIATFSDLPYGTYAVAVIHDANENGKLDTNLIGMPIEAYGFSNDARRMFGPPRFDQASFRLDGEEARITIHVR